MYRYVLKIENRQLVLNDFAWCFPGKKGMVLMTLGYKRYWVVIDFRSSSELEALQRIQKVTMVKLVTKWPNILFLLKTKIPNLFRNCLTKFLQTKKGSDKIIVSK